MTGPIVLACDEQFAMPLATVLRSMAEASPPGTSLEVHVLSDGFREELKRKVEESIPADTIHIHWREIDLAPFSSFLPPSHISKLTYARLLIPALFPPTVVKALYMDADVLVLDDVQKLWQIYLDDDYPVGAVADGLSDRLRDGDPLLKDLPRVDSYFNAGVLLMNLKTWRSRGISERAFEYLQQNPATPFCDQDALNVACDGLWRQLDERWNFQNHYDTPLSEMANGQRPGIVHFVTKVKPWDASQLSVNASFYNDFRKKTCFARTPQQVMLDAITNAWYRIRRSLRNYALIRVVWNVFTRRRVSMSHLP
jgi:lipopolysaccharide biosynthesis glycosyltransferase